MLNYKTILLIVLFAAPALFGIYEVARAHRLSNEVEAYKVQIATLKAESELDKKRFSIAEAQASSEVKESQKEVDVIMKADVPKKCNEALEWGINQAAMIK